MAEEGPTQDQQRPMDVHEVLASTLEFFAMLGWQKMGLQPDMATGKIETDYSQARVAVDTVAALATVLEPSLTDEQDKRQIQNLVRDLRVNYVEKSGGTH